MTEFIAVGKKKSKKAYLRQDGSWATPEEISPNSVAKFISIHDGLKEVNFSKSDGLTDVTLIEYDGTLFLQEL